MNRQSIHLQIESLLKVITEQHTLIKDHEGSIGQIEIDYLLQNLRQLYEATLMLNHTNALSSLDEVKAAVTQRILAENRAIEMRKSETEKVIEQKPEPSVNKTEAVETKKEFKEEVTERPVQTTVPAAHKEKAGHDLNSSLYHEQNTLGKQFSSTETLHKKVASTQSGKSLSDKLHRKPIKDLRNAIGINEKFLFVSRLFNGNLQGYSEAIEKLNSKDSYETAKQYIDNELASKLDWDAKDEHVQHFLELIERRFS